MKTLADVDNRGLFGYEVNMYSLILRMWYIIVNNNITLLNNSTTLTFADRQRVKILTNFIHHNYMEFLSLSDIAKSDNISRGECCRVFKRVLNMSPFSYLLNFRIHQSIKLLATSNMTIADIAQVVGFGSGSYFTSCFKKIMHCSPISYRKQVKKEQSNNVAHLSQLN